MQTINKKAIVDALKASGSKERGIGCCRVYVVIVSDSDAKEIAKAEPQESGEDKTK